MISACTSSSSEAVSGQETASSETKLSDNQFGEAIDAEGAISYDALLDMMEQSDSVAVKVKGKVEAVCQAKGCWMNIAGNESDAEEMMVKFKDYGFFVPKDIAGREVVMEGYAFREVTPVDELRHLAQDAGKSKEEIDQITEPVVELKFLASGVLLLDAM
ncbi:MAG: DUF4920 domain-containing protein [Lewinella sp.]|nr:DUF4920 domain-containing protein [Lewinella sp.]